MTDTDTTLLLGDCAERMRELQDCSVDSIVCDPPYGIAFMGSKWDNYGQRCGDATVDERRRIGEDYAEAHAGAPRYGNSRCDTRNSRREMLNFQAAMTPIFAEALRVAKPGAYMCCFGSPRTYHRLTCAIEDAGWNVVDCVMFVHGQGFPKGQNVGKQVEVLLTRGKSNSRALRQVEQEGDGETYTAKQPRNGMMNAVEEIERKTFSPATDDAKEWAGWNTQLKPAYEPIVIAQKPVEKTIARNVLKHGTGAFNVDACSVPTGNESVSNHSRSAESAVSKGRYGDSTAQETHQTEGQKLGRYPANLVHDGSPEVLALFPTTGKSRGGGGVKRVGTHVYDGGYKGKEYDTVGFMDSGSAARFFYCAKPSRSERNKNCERLLTWEHDQELIRLIEKSNQLVKAISESMMQTLDGIVCSMSSSGNGSMEKSQTECKSTMSTVLNLITELKISCSSHRSNTNDYILDAIKTSEESGINVVQLAEKLNRLKLDFTNDEMAIAMNAASALLNELAEIRKNAMLGNHHPTLKSVALMRWLVRLVTRRGGLVLDPFMGSGTTGIAALQEGMRFVGIEREEKYMEIAKRRIMEAAAEIEQARENERHELVQQELPL